MRSSNRFSTPWICLFAAGCFLSACNFPNPSPAADTPSPTQTHPLMISSPAIQIAITQTNTALPLTATLQPATAIATAVPVLPSATPTDMTVKVFLIAIEDNGVSGLSVGCGDSAVAVTLHVPYTAGMLHAALTSLLAIHDQYYGGSGLYNALYQSRLTVGDVAINSGAATVHLTGTLMLGGECDSPRVDAQLKQTALQFSTVHSVSIFVNDTPLENLLFGR